MGLLEKAQQRKQELEKLEDTVEEPVVNEPIDDQVKPSGLLAKASLRKQEIASGKIEPTKTYSGVKAKGSSGQDVVEEKKGFGWKGLGTRRIVFEHNTSEYIYELLEPELNEDEKETKEELSHLFKMLSDVNIAEVNDEDKSKFLEETLEQIVIDNDIKFGVKIKKKDSKKKPKDSPKSKGDKNKKEKKSFFKKKSDKEEKTEKAKKSLFKNKKEKKSFFKKKDDKGEKTEKVKRPLFKNKKEKKSLFKRKDNKEEKTEKAKKSLFKIRKEKTKEELEYAKLSKEEREAKAKESKEEREAKAKESKDKIFYHIFREFLGYGRINIIMKDEGIEDISCDGHHTPIFLYHKKYDEITTNVHFDGELELNSFVVRLAQICGKQISIFSPIVDGKLPDGSRLQTTLARTVTQGSTFTIRKFKENPLTPVDLIGYESFSLDMAAYFWMAIEKGASILFCGGTASGKTTALNALSLFIPAAHKVISIEDTREINLPHKNWIAGTTRKGFSANDDKTGKDIDMFDLIRAALRQRPKVVMVGEVRGKEAYSLFQAMATGHTAYATIHASTIHTLIQRLENPPIELPRALLTSLDVIVFQNAVDIGGKTVRRTTSITEIIKLDPDTNQLIFMEPFRWISKTDDRFESSGTSKILNNIKLQNSWSEEQLIEELENRKIILEWMLKKNIRDYKDVGRVVYDYSKYPEELLKKAREELKQ